MQKIIFLTFFYYSIPECVLLNECLEDIAKKHPTRKFIKIVANKCIENYMDCDCPGLLIYKNGDLADKIIPAGDIFGGKRMNRDTVEFVLGFKKLIDVEYDEDPRDKLKVFNAKVAHKGSTKNTKSRKQNEDQSGSEDEDDREYSTN